MGAAGTLKDYSTSLPETDRVECFPQWSMNPSGSTANLLNMTRIESGAMEPKTSFHYVGDFVGSALRRGAKILHRHKAEIDIPADLPMLKIDPVLFEQVLFNLLDNDAKYAPAGTKIRILGRADGEYVNLQLKDEGPGVPVGDLERIFDTFYWVRKTDHVRAGTGLGLSICRGFIEAMGGSDLSGEQGGPHRRSVHDPHARPRQNASSG